MVIICSTLLLHILPLSALHSLWFCRKRIAQKLPSLRLAFVYRSTKHPNSAPYGKGIAAERIMQSTVVITTSSRHTNDLPKTQQQQPPALSSAMAT